MLRSRWIALFNAFACCTAGLQAKARKSDMRSTDATTNCSVGVLLTSLWEVAIVPESTPGKLNPYDSICSNQSVLRQDDHLNINVLQLACHSDQSSDHGLLWAGAGKNWQTCLKGPCLRDHTQWTCHLLSWSPQSMRSWGEEKKRFDFLCLFTRIARLWLP